MNARSERYHLADGVVPAVGQRVVVVRHVAERWGLSHAYDDLVHEITSLIGDDSGLVECGPRQIGVAMLRLAPEGSEITCPHCRGWAVQRERWRIDAQVCRELQFETGHLRRALAEMLERFAPDDDGLSEAEIASAARARSALRAPAHDTHGPTRTHTSAQSAVPGGDPGQGGRPLAVPHE